MKSILRNLKVIVLKKFDVILMFFVVILLAVLKFYQNIFSEFLSIIK